MPNPQDLTGKRISLTYDRLVQTDGANNYFDGLGNPLVIGGVGPQGPQGDQGAQGDQGSQGDQGAQGDQGPQGDQGFQGPQGNQGASSSFFPYKAKTTINSGDPASSYLIWNNLTQINSTQINISHIDDNGIDIDIFLATLSATEKFIIQDRNDSNNYQTWTISSALTIQTGYVEIPVTLFASGGTGTTNFANDEQIFVALISGVTGPQGPQGVQGSTGSQGPQGDQGPQGFQGNQGDQGPQGAQGDQGFEGLDGANSGRWILSDVSNADPTGNDFTTDDIIPANITRIKIQYANQYTVDYFQWLDSIRILFNSGRTPLIQIYTTVNTTSMGIWEVTAVIDDGISFFRLDVTNIVGGDKLQVGEPHTISWVVNGAQGAQGNQGNQGAQGSQGPQGNQGAQGATGVANFNEVQLIAFLRI